MTQTAYGGPGGHCPRVLNPFLSTSYHHTLHCNRVFIICQQLLLKRFFFHQFGITHNIDYFFDSAAFIIQFEYDSKCF